MNTSSFMYATLEERRAMEAVKSMAEVAGIDMDAEPEKMMTLLSQHMLRHAVTTGNMKSLDKALERADVNERIVGEGNKLPVELAIQNGYLEVLDVLLSLPTPETKEEDDDRPVLSASTTELFAAAVRSNNEEALGAIMEKRAEVPSVELVHVAAAADQMEMLKLLCGDFDMPADDADERGLTPLMAACAKGAAKCAFYLCRVKGASLDKSDQTGRTPLHYAALGNDATTVALLLRQGASRLATEKGGMTPFFLAVSQSKYNAIQTLLSPTEAEDDEDVRIAQAAPCQGMPPMILAAMRGDVKTVEILRGVGFPDPADPSGRTALDVAKQRRAAKMAHLRQQLDARRAANASADQAGAATASSAATQTPATTPQQPQPASEQKKTKAASTAATKSTKRRNKKKKNRRK